MALHPDWLAPVWPAPPHVHSVFTTRVGGVSKPPFDSFNLGRPVGDDESAVQTNRQRLCDAVGALPVFLSQVHGVHSVELPGPSDVQSKHLIEADACVSAVPGVVCAVRVADCLPVLWTDTQGRVVAATHAGWRGLAGGVVERSFAHFAQLLARHGGEEDPAVLATRTLAWLGPCIGPQAFEVGPEVRQAFVATDPGAGHCFTPLPGGKFLADLPALARRRLHALGVSRIYGNDGSRTWCTVSNPSRFFSHRRDSVALGGSGRMAACIWIGQRHSFD